MAKFKTLLKLRTLEQEACQLILAQWLTEEARLKEKLGELHAQMIQEQQVLAQDPVFQKDWPQFVKASKDREQEIGVLLADVEVEITKARTALGNAFRAVKTLEIVRDRHILEEKKHQDKAQQDLMDEIGLRSFN